jgi:hypothetical protein
MNKADLKPGDVLCVGTPNFTGWWIRFRSWLLRKPYKQNHIAMFTHFDDDGNPRGLEGKPSSFGWVNLNQYIDGPMADRVVTNAGKTSFPDHERTLIVSNAKSMMGMAYDWKTIISFCLAMLGMPFRSREWPENGLPSDATCASSLDLLYEQLGWPNPGGVAITRYTDVDDWVEHIRITWP